MSAMSPTVARLVTYAGSAVIAAATVLALALTVARGEEVFAARLISGLAGCL